jgi:DNA-binding NarL/FixJ family response regulator
VVLDVIKDMLASVDDILVVAAETDGTQAIAAALRYQPEVVVLDLNMPGCDGLSAIQTIRRRIAAQRILVLTVSEQKDDLTRALQYGARGYILKRDHIRDIVTAIRKIAGGEIVISHRLVNRLINDYRADAAGWESLKENDRRILNLCESGLTSTSIAERVALPEAQINTRLQLFLEMVCYRLRYPGRPISETDLLKSQGT